MINRYGSETDTREKFLVKRLENVLFFCLCRFTQYISRLYGRFEGRPNRVARKRTEKSKAAPTLQNFAA